MSAAAQLLAVALSPAMAQPYFTDQAVAAGVGEEMNISGSPQDKEYILEAHGSGAAFFDYDNDGDQDLYVVNGSDFDHYHGRSGPGNLLYRNRGDGTFGDVTDVAAVGDAGWGAGCAVGDIDNDGFDDLYVTNYRANVLYHNSGESHFADITAAAGVGGEAYSAAAAFFDYDNAGDLDLYSASYVAFDLKDNPRTGCDYLGGIKTYCGPLGMAGGADVLYRNDGDGGRFTDVTAASGVSRASTYYGLGVMPSDYDGDGDLDLYVANDQTPNVLFNNKGDGTFEDVALISGVAYSSDGDEEAGMGVDFGDFDNDGDDDLYVTNFFRESNTLYRNAGGRFADFTVEAGIEAVTMNKLGWGTRFADFDNDGDLDLFVANGHVFPGVDDAATGTTYRQTNQLLRNDSTDGTVDFVDISASAGPGMAIEKVSRGAAFADYDDDGDVDVFVVNLNDTPTLLRNELIGDGNRPDRGNWRASSNWLVVEVGGATAAGVNGGGRGTRVRVVNGGHTQFRTIEGAGSYLSHSDQRAHFGLGSAQRADLVEVEWLDGSKQTATAVPANRTVTARGGRGRSGELSVGGEEKR